MKHFITFVFILLSYLSYGQITGTQVLAFQGNVTSTIRDGLDVPSGQYWMIYNTTTLQLEVSDDTDTWSAFGGGGLASTDIDTYSELNTIVADVTLTHNGLIDTFAELDVIVADAALSKVSGTPIDDQVALWGSANTLEGDADLTYNSTTNLLSSGGVFSSGRLEGKQFIWNTAGASTDEWVAIASNEENPELSFYMFDGGYDSGSVTQSYSLHVGALTDATDIVNLGFLQAGLDDLASVIDASAFSGNLATTDDTIQELADKVDGLSVGTGTVDTSGTPADNQLAIFTDANTLEGSSLVTFNGTTFTVDGPFDLSQNQINNVTSIEHVYTTGTNEVTTNFLGGNDIFALAAPNDASQALRYTFSTGYWFFPYDNSTSGLTAGDVWAALDELTADVAAITPGTPPFADTGSIVEGSADGTKELRFEVDGLTTATTRTWTAPDRNIDFGTIAYSTTVGEPTGADRIENTVSLTQAEYDAGTPNATTHYVITDAKTPEVIQIACSDLVTNITTGTTKAYFRMPWAATLLDVRASALDGGDIAGGDTVIDINENGTTVLSTKITIEDDETTSESATTPPVISDSALADDALMTIDFDTVGTNALGIIVTLYVEY